MTMLRFEKALLSQKIILNITLRWHLHCRLVMRMVIGLDETDIATCMTVVSENILGRLKVIY